MSVWPLQSNRTSNALQQTWADTYFHQKVLVDHIDMVGSVSGWGVGVGGTTSDFNCVEGHLVERDGRHGHTSTCCCSCCQVQANMRPGGTWHIYEVGVWCLKCNFWVGWRDLAPPPENYTIYHVYHIHTVLLCFVQFTLVWPVFVFISQTDWDNADSASGLYITFLPG